MRKILLAIPMLLWCIAIHAQIEKGSIMIGGSAGFQFRKTDKTTTDIQFSASPNFLYSVIKQFAIGGQVSYVHAYNKRIEPTQTVVLAQNIFSIGPAVRANIRAGEKTVFFIHAASSFGVNASRDPRDKTKVFLSISNIGWRAGPGISIFTTKSMAVELGLFYDGMRNIYTLRQQKNVISKSAPEFAHGLTFAIGLQFYTVSKKNTPKKIEIRD